MERYFLLFQRPLDMIIVNVTCAISGEVQGKVNCGSKRFLTVYDLHSALDDAQLTNAEVQRSLEKIQADGEALLETDRAACVRLGLLVDFQAEP